MLESTYLDDFNRDIFVHYKYMYIMEILSYIIVTYFIWYLNVTEYQITYSSQSGHGTLFLALV